LGTYVPSIIAGDFNQRIPRIHTPHAVHAALLDAIGGYRVATEGAIPGINKASIDHIAHGPELAAEHVFGISNIAADGKHLSDHFGVAADLYL
jgi:endonuclease/exonuclease/phosphatase family metal-dependent hydrolase